jgi:hypothetical protein
LRVLSRSSSGPFVNLFSFLIGPSFEAEIPRQFSGTLQSSGDPLRLGVDFLTSSAFSGGFFASAGF